MADQSKLFRTQCAQLTVISGSMQDVARTYFDRSVTSGDLEKLQKRVEQFKDALHTMYWAFHSASFDVRNAERDAERAARNGAERAARNGAPDLKGGTCTVVFGGEAFTVLEGADIETRKGQLFANGVLVATKWPGASIAMVGGTFGNVTLC